MIGIALVALEQTKHLTGRSDAWLDFVTGDRCPPMRSCRCEACAEFFRIIDGFSNTSSGEQA